MQDGVRVSVQKCMKLGKQRTWCSHYVYSAFTPFKAFSLSSFPHRHNLGLQHSTEAGDEYGHGSCMMGADYFSLAFPAICFNAQKNYLLGWYSDYQITVDPATNGAWSGKLVSFVDYPKASTLNNAYVLIVVGQLYIQYNLAGEVAIETGS